MPTATVSRPSALVDTPTPVDELRSRLWSHLVPLLYVATTAVTCAWVLHLPVFPSQDAPLHRYYVHIFSELLSGKSSPYTALYSVRHWLPPYATYYYGLALLGHVVSLETADKLFVTASIALFAASGWALLRAVAPRSRWAPFVLLPVLLNWPTFMGFANYMLSVDLACFAIAAWLRAGQLRSGDERSRTRLFVAYLGCIVLIMFTHPLPWVFAVGFAALELALRHGREFRVRYLRRELVVLALGCLPYVYLAHFRATTRFIEGRRFNPKLHAWQMLHAPTFLQRLQGQGFNLIHMQGIVLFLGHGPARPYRLALNALMGGAVLLSGWSLFRNRHRLSEPARTWDGHLTRVWFLFGSLLACAILLVPDNFAGAYFFTSRLQLVVYLAFVAAAARSLGRLRRVAVVVAAFSMALSLFTLALAVRYVDPAARTVLSVRQIPPVSPGAKPGLLLRPVGVAYPAHLNFDSFNWAPVDYLRVHELPLYNTSWLGEPLIPLRLTPRGRAMLDPTFFNQAPQYGEDPMLNEERAENLLHHAAFAVIQRESIKRSQNPFAILGGSPTAAEFAQGWTCRLTGSNHWYFCRPPHSGS